MVPPVWMGRRRGGCYHDLVPAQELDGSGGEMIAYEPHGTVTRGGSGAHGAQAACGGLAPAAAAAPKSATEAAVK